MSQIQYSWLCFKKDLKKRSILENILPSNYNYKISSFKVLHESEIKNESKFEAVISVNICSEEALQTFLKDFETSSSTIYNIYFGDNRSGKKVVVSGHRKCHHNVRKRSKSGDPLDVVDDKTVGKQTNCPADIKFKLKRTDDHEHDDNCLFFPLELTMNYTHNHSIESANAVKFHEVTDDTKNRFKELFENAHSAASAYQEYKNYLMDKHGDNYVMVSADRAIMPDYKWVFNFHATFIQKEFGKINSPEAFKKAVDKVKDYNDKHGDILCTIEQTEDGETIVVVCDKLSRRVHKVLPQAGDIVYVDATSNLDRQDSKLIKFMTCSPAGGLPLGFIISSSESEKTLKQAFDKFKQILPDDAFFKRGKDKGPALFMTDDADAEINALHTIWPDATLLLCVWHVLNAVWRWLWKSEHQIKKDDRPHLLVKFRDVLYANTESEYEIKKNDLLCDQINLKYPNFLKHLENSYFKRKDVWAISVRNDKGSFQI